METETTEATDGNEMTAREDVFGMVICVATLLFFSGFAAGAVFVRFGEPFTFFHIPTWILGVMAIGYFGFSTLLLYIQADLYSDYLEELDSEPCRMP